MQMSVDEWLELGQHLINDLPLGEKFCLTELYGEYWEEVPNEREFGHEFMKAVSDDNYHFKLKNIRFVRIRPSGRCNEYERI